MASCDYQGGKAILATKWPSDQSSSDAKGPGGKILQAVQNNLKDGSTHGQLYGNNAWVY